MKYLLLLSLLCTACTLPAPIHYSQPGISNREMVHDRMQCKQLANQYVLNNGFAGNTFVDYVLNDEESHCMKELGYR